MSFRQSEYARTEQIITRFQLKALQAILGSRIPNFARPITDPARARRRDCWFNLDLGDLPSALENPSHGVMDPVVVDVILSPADAILERWTTAFDLRTAAPAAAGEGSLYRKAYKRSFVLLLRSLYSLLRLLPCFKIFKMLAASNQSYNYDLSCRVSSFAAPFSREEERELTVYPFAPIDTQFGHISLSVSYSPDLSEFNFDVPSLMPAIIIADYVGSPAVDPMRAFPVLPAHKSTAGSGSRPIWYPLGNFVTGSNSPPVLPGFQLPHSLSEVLKDGRDDSRRSCPFVVDDVDTSNSQSRNLDRKEAPESSQSYNSPRKSQDAAVGALFHMLNTAAPLRQDQSYSSQSSRSEVTGKVGNSSFFVARKISDALDELKSYRETKEILLS